MALFQGTDAPEDFSFNSPGQANITVLAAGGNDRVFVSADISESVLSLDGQNDLALFLAGFSNSGGLSIDSTTVNAGAGVDKVKVFAETVDDLQINLDAGNDFAQLSSDPSSITWEMRTYRGGGSYYKPTGDARAEYTNTRIYGGDASPTDGDQGPLNTGIDVVVVDDTVRVFNQSLIDLGNNSNGLLPPGVNDINSFLFFRSNFLNPIFTDNLDDLAGDPGYDVLANLGYELALIQADEVFQSTVRGNDGSDVILFDSFDLLNFNSYNGFLENLNPSAQPWKATTRSQDFDFLISDSPLTQSLVNGNKDADVIAILRDVDQSRIFGGQDNDTLIQLGASARFSRFNGNQGADLVLDYNLLSQNVTNSGGQGDDTIQAGAIEVTNSLYSGDNNDDKVNFIAVQSTNTTLRGGAGDDVLSDSSGLLRNLGNVLDGGTGADLLRQNAGIVFEQILQYGSTFIGGEGADTMIGDYAPGTIFGEDSPEHAIIKSQSDQGFRLDITDGKGLRFEQSDTYTPIEEVEVNGERGRYELFGASSDLFRFDYGDSAINQFGTGRDRIVDFDSDASWYSTGDALDVFTYKPYKPELDDLERDEIDLAPDGNVGPGVGPEYNIKYGLSTLGVQTNNQGRVISSENLFTFIDGAAQSTVAGAAYIWEQYGAPFINTAQVSDGIFDFQTGQTPVTSQLFISDGVAGVTDGDLLIQLDNVGGFNPNGSGGLFIANGNIENIVTGLG